MTRYLSCAYPLVSAVRRVGCLGLGLDVAKH